MQSMLLMHLMVALHILQAFVLPGIEKVHDDVLADDQRSQPFLEMGSCKEKRPTDLSLEQQLESQLREVEGKHQHEVLEGIVFGLISQVEMQAEHDSMQMTLQAKHLAATSQWQRELDDLRSEVEAAREVAGAKNWLSIQTKLGQQKSQIKALMRELAHEREDKEQSLRMLREQLAETSNRLKKVAIGNRSLKQAEDLWNQMQRKDTSKSIVQELQNKEWPPVDEYAAQAGLSTAQFNALLRHLENVLYGSGKGDAFRTKLLLVALLDRPAVSRLLGSEAPHTKKISRVARDMLDSARAVLSSLSSEGTKRAADRLHFESILTSLIPDDAKEKRVLSIVMTLLGISKRQLYRACKRKQSIAKQEHGSFSRVVSASLTRKQRKDYNERGRELCSTFWHSNTRFDTNSRKKKRHRVATNSYIEHWRHVQYDTNQQMWDAFKNSAEYGAYLLLGGAPISECFFFQMKCWCIEQADHEECACPLCTQMFELIRDWHSQRSSWYRDADKRQAADPNAVGECNCGHCEIDAPYRNISKSVHTLNDFVLCPKQGFPSLCIPEGKSPCNEEKFRRRQCCRAPLLSKHINSTMSDACKECEKCGFERRMPRCPIEHSSDPAHYKVYMPSGPNNQEVLTEVDCTRAEFMAQLQKIYQQWLPHHWVKVWCSHQRRLTYATLDHDEACIMTDFSAAYDHKAFATKCCEQPHHSNMDVFVVSLAQMTNGKREIISEVVRVISEAKGSAHFHNVALHQIVQHIRTQRPRLKRVYVFTDGCKAQYKGRKNFGRIAEFPSVHDGVQIIHRFSASHHFKGPHDGYGKDAKALSRTAEKNKKRRLADTFDWYEFLATEMASPIKTFRTIREQVESMEASQAAIDAACAREAHLAHLETIRSRRPLIRVKLHVNLEKQVGVSLISRGSAVHKINQTKRAISKEEAKGLFLRKAKAQRSAQRRRIVQVAEGCEATGMNGQPREVTSMSNGVNGYFKATQYHWLFYGLPGMGLKDGIPFGVKCSRG